MPRAVVPLNDTKIRTTKPGLKPIRLSDGDGLYLLVLPDGRKRWQFDFTYRGRRSTLSFGAYGDVSLAQARDKRAAARQLVANGIDPTLARREARAPDAQPDTFFDVAKEWLAKRQKTWAPSTYEASSWMLLTQVAPFLGRTPIGEIEPPVLLGVLRRIEQRGALYLAGRVRAKCSEVFRYAISTGRCVRDPAADLRGALERHAVTHFAALTEPEDVRALLRAIDGYRGTPVVCAALRIAPYVFARPGEVRRMEWTEINMTTREWRVPDQKMKRRQAHIVPLARQVVEILDDLRPLTGAGRYVFPSNRGKGRPMSENTINSALRRLGYESTDMVGHGFRAMATTLLNEMGWDERVVDRQLAHVEKSSSKRPYNRAQYLPERRRLMQAWADYLDGLKGSAPGTVVLIGRTG